MDLSDRGGMGTTKHGKSGRPPKNARVKNATARFFSEEEKRGKRIREQVQKSCAFASIGELIRSSTRRK